MTGLGRAVRLVVIGTTLLALTPGIAHADVYAAVADDPTNELWDCATRRVPLTSPGQDVLRCLTFKFDAPDEVRSAVLYLDIDAPTNSLQDTDSLIVAVDQPFDDCAWAHGAMPGCVAVHGGFRGGERSLVVDLLNIACDASAPAIDAQRQDSVTAAVESGTLHVMLQDDTVVNGGWLDINGDTAPACGTSVAPVPANVLTQTSSKSGRDDGPGPGLIVGAAAGVAVLAVAGLTTTKRTKVRRAHRRVQVRRVSHPGQIDVDHSSEPDQPHSASLGITTVRDDIGMQSLSKEVR